ncbi:hypothetical protein NITGR_150044 [Nitrospina gracilis 3/211]|uniref:HTH luxR-type domain-containing protein n=2 Tax=Nitrospinaceae TaxID=407032 RepID=M1YVQ5_NITG3|nr:hypothetical protein NITGR_150044 [Nitrospina gracilis 3/211]
MIMDDRNHTSLPEKDYLKIIEIIQALNRCQIREDINLVALNHLLPLVEADHMGVAFSGMDIGNKQHLPCRVFMGSFKNRVELSDQEYEAIEKAFPYYKSTAKTLLETFRPVISHDIDIPREELQKELSQFFADHPQYNRDKFFYLKNIESTLAVMEPRDWNLAMGFNRFYPGAKFWTRREIRLIELLRPTLFTAVKRVAIQEQVKTHKALVAALDQTGAPMALVGEGGRVLYRNAAFSTMVEVDTGGVLPRPMRELVEQQVARMSPDEIPESGAPLLAFFPQGQAVYRLDFTQLFRDGNRADPAWILRLHPVDDPYTRLRLNLQKAGLTPREMETAILAGDGLDDVDIAQRLFISPNTLKNHFKSIYRKLDVHSRTQLVARLRPPPEP